MNLDELTIGQVKELQKMLVCNNITDATCNKHPMVGKVCVVRTYSAGVHIGEIVSIDGTNCEMKNAQRLFTWDGAFTLTEVANIGVAKSSRLSMPTVIYLTQAVELIPCSEKAIISFSEAKQG